MRILYGVHEGSKSIISRCVFVSVIDILLTVLI